MARYDICPSRRSMQRILATRSYPLRPQISKSGPAKAQLFRLQHGGPHKEYFQNPGRMPLPETPTIPRIDNPLHDFPQQPSLLRRFLSNAGLGLWSLLFGLGAGSSLMTWAYLQGVLEAGTEEEIEMLDQITDMMSEYPALEALLNEPWEEWPVASRMVSGDSGKGLHFVTGTLTGSKGIVQRTFFNRNLGLLVAIVYIGNGVEGWPDVVHGGVLTTLLKEAMEKVAAEVFPAGTGGLSKMSIQFKRKVTPGEIYSLCAIPASRVAMVEGGSVESQFKMQPTERKDSIIAYIERADAPVHQATLVKTTHTFGYGVFRVRHPFQLDEHGKIT